MPFRSTTIFTLAYLLLLSLVHLPQQKTPFKLAILYNKSIADAHPSFLLEHYDDVIMTMLASQITSLMVVYSIVYSGVNQRKHQSSASLAFVREIHRGPVNFPHKWPVTRKMFPFDDVIMGSNLVHSLLLRLPAPMCSLMAVANVTRLSVVTLCGRNPYRYSLNCVLAIVNALFSTMLSMFFETQLSNEMGLNALRLSGLGMGTCSACFQLLGKRLSLYNLSIKASNICLAPGPVWCSMLLCTPSDPGDDFLLTCNTLFNSCIVNSWSCIKSGCSKAFATIWSLIGAKLLSSLSTISGKLSMLVLPANSVASNSACAWGSGCLRGLGWPRIYFNLRHVLASLFSNCISLTIFSHASRLAVSIVSIHVALAAL